MAYRIAGTYVASCNCNPLCPCPVDGKPTSADGQCRGVAVFAVKEGDLDGTDVSGVNFALYNHFPANITSGNWTVGIVVDESASDEQAQAIERIISGQEGGPFGEFVPLIGDYKGMERASVTFSDGDSPSGTVGGMSEFSFEPLRGGDGTPTTVKNAMFGFSPEFTVGRTSGRSDGFGLSFESVYGEHAEFDYSTETTGVHPRA